MAETDRPTVQTLVLGIGNTLLSDEGAGVRVIQALQEMDVPDGVSCLDGGTLSFTLAGPIGDCQQLIVIDAAELHAEPGTIRVFEADAMDAFLARGGKRSVHEVGLTELMGMVALTGQLPSRRALVGIQPAQVDWGTSCTPQVTAAIPSACEQVLSLQRLWLKSG